MGRINSKNKGGKNERELCKALKDWSGYDFSRVPQSGGLRWRKTENTTGDIICSDDRHKGKFIFSVETKFHNEINFQHLLLPNGKNKILEFWAQAVSDANRGKKIPLLFMRYNGMPKQTWFMVIELTNYISIKQLIKPHSKLRYERPDGLKRFVILNSNDFFKSDYKLICKKLRHG